jgi:tRNA nucleotidyltransferase (CCA-adding enzyme)
MLEDVDAFRRPERFEDFLLACEADARGRTGRETVPYTQADLIRQAREAAAKISAEQFKNLDLSGEALGAAIHKKRAEAIAQVKAEFRPADES